MVAGARTRIEYEPTFTVFGCSTVQPPKSYPQSYPRELKSRGTKADARIVGVATLKRAAVTNTLAREARGEGGGGLLAEIGRFVSGKLTGLASLYPHQLPVAAGTPKVPPGALLLGELDTPG